MRTCELPLFIRRVDSNGNYDCDVILEEKGKKVGSIVGLRAKGGRFGSKLNLMSDGAQNAGKKLGMMLREEMNRRER